VTDETERTPEDALPEAADAQGPTDLDAVATGIPDDDDANPFGEIVDATASPAAPPMEQASTDDFRSRAKLLPDHDTWLERPATIRLLKFGSLALLAATVVAEFVFVPESKPHFDGIDGWLGFHAVYGFFTCVLMVLGAKFVLGYVLKRKDTYYDG
jgi:hypothetical protein